MSHQVTCDPKEARSGFPLHTGELKTPGDAGGVGLNDGTGVGVAEGAGVGEAVVVDGDGEGDTVVVDGDGDGVLVDGDGVVVGGVVVTTGSDTPGAGVVDAPGSEGDETGTCRHARAGALTITGEWTYRRD